ncbi:MAG: sulfotransferase family protein [Rhodopirellula sp. JB053]
MNQFFLFGYNKSGTTFLQQLIDSHLQVNCPPEHHLNSVINAIESFCPQYKLVIERFDQRTGQQGIRFDKNLVMHHTFRGFVEAFMRCGATKNTTHVGVNDNSMGLNLEFVASVFPKAKFIAILRDPREVAVPLFHHKMRTEPEFRERNGTLSAVAHAVAPAWANHMRKLRNFLDTHSHGKQLQVTRYQDLIGADNNLELQRLFAHLQVPVDKVLIDKILTANNFTKAKRRPAENVFFAIRAERFLDGGTRA